MRARLIRYVAIALLPMIFRAVKNRMSDGGKDANTFDQRDQRQDEFGRSEDENTF